MFLWRSNDNYPQKFPCNPFLSGALVNPFFSITGVPVCMPSYIAYEDIARLSLGCDWPSANILSGSYLGLLRHENYWKIVRSPSRGHLLYHFDDFDVGCDTGTEFKLKHTRNSEWTTYCNIKRPIGKFATLRLDISFLENRRSDSLIEGFSASYVTMETMQKEENIASLGGDILSGLFLMFQ